MQINVSKGHRTIKLTKGEQAAMRHAEQIVSELANATGEYDLETTAVRLSGIIGSIDAKGVFASQPDAVPAAGKKSARDKETE